MSDEKIGQSDSPAETPADEPDPRVLAGLDEPRGVRTKAASAGSGYVIFSPLCDDITYLIDRDGLVVHMWKSDYAPTGSIYLLDNGHLIRGGREPEVPVFYSGGQGGRIQEFTWDGELVWDYLFASEEHLLHHDLEVLSNGNVLAIAWERKTVEDAQRAGRKPERTPKGGLWPDKIVELEPLPPNDARIVWEWHMWDHTIQNHDVSLDGYGEPSEHPELIDINGGRPLPEMTQEELEKAKAAGNVSSNTRMEDLGADMLHTNAIHYNPELDQIVISVPTFNEIWIIDHCTTTREASGHSGGRWGRGGDLLYRWGNPRTYGRGEQEHQRLFGQHDVRWIPSGLPGAGNLMVFSNNAKGEEGVHSCVVEVVTPLDDAGYHVPDSRPFEPREPVWSYAAPGDFHSPFISGAHRMANGHTLITSGAQGRFFEVTPEHEIVWEYWTPYAGDVRMPDGSRPHPVDPFVYSVFRATFVAPDHPALLGKALNPLEPQPVASIIQQDQE